MKRAFVDLNYFSIRQLVRPIMEYANIVWGRDRVGSGSDDLAIDNLGHLGHFFGGSSGFHLQTKQVGFISSADQTIFYPNY